MKRNVLEDPAIDGQLTYFKHSLVHMMNTQLKAIDKLSLAKTICERNLVIQELKKITDEIPRLISIVEGLALSEIYQGYAHSTKDTPRKLASKKNDPYRKIEQDAQEQYTEAVDYAKTKGKRKISKTEWAKKNLDRLCKKHKQEVTLRTFIKYITNL
jgi:hypothetical protein